MEEPPSARTEHERAIDLAWRAVSRRERTVAELRAFLERKRVEPEAIAAAVKALTEAGQLDDAAYARRFAEEKRALERWGRERIARELRRRGVDPGLVEEALAAHDHEAELETALELLARRSPLPSANDRERDRAWQLLVRRGYEPELAYEAVRLHERRAAGGRRAA